MFLGKSALSVGGDDEIGERIVTLYNLQHTFEDQHSLRDICPRTRIHHDDQNSERPVACNTKNVPYLVGPVSPIFRSNLVSDGPHED